MCPCSLAQTNCAIPNKTSLIRTNDSWLTHTPLPVNEVVEAMPYFFKREGTLYGFYFISVWTACTTKPVIPTRSDMQYQGRHLLQGIRTILIANITSRHKKLTPRRSTVPAPVAEMSHNCTQLRISLTPVPQVTSKNTVEYKSLSCTPTWLKWKWVLPVIEHLT